nr:uncharacterized protein LOC123746926 isoform X2 [Procambarus clarkii]
MAVRGTIPRRLLLPLLVFWGGSAVDNMVEDFTAEAVSWSAIATTWLPPQCNSDPIVEYTVSLLGISFNRYWVTDQVYTTNYTWNKLRNNNRYTVCVKPVRGNESCLSLNTLLERPNTLRVEDSPRGELLVTWTYDNCPYEGCYSVIYNVSWGTALENFVVTTLKKYTIKGYNAEDPRVCVTAINTDTYAVSTNTCLGDPDVEPIIPTMEPTPSSPANPGLILGLSCAAIILGAGVVVSVVVRIRNRNRLPIIRTTSRPTESKQKEFIRTKPAENSPETGFPVHEIASCPYSGIPTTGNLHQRVLD